MASDRHRLDSLEARLDAIEKAMDAPGPDLKRAGALPPEVEAAVAIRHTGDIFAAQNTRTVAQAMLRQGATAETVRDSILSEGVVID